MSPWGSKMRIRATPRRCPERAGNGSACQYEICMTPRARILVVDDDKDIRGLLTELLTRAGFEVDQAPDGRTALRRLYEAPPSLVILDVSMPGMDGYQTLERIRDLSDVPVIMLTARAEELEKVRGLSGGADDYVAKPFGRQELLARIQAQLRRSGGKTEVTETYNDAFVEIDYGQRRVTAQGRAVQLTPLEFRLLAAFVQHPSQVLSREQLLELVWSDPFSISGDQVKLYVGYLRKKLVPHAPDTAPIETVRGFGYRYRKTVA
jgi:DNA-binding response OmpR family regulator